MSVSCNSAYPSFSVYLIHYVAIYGSRTVKVLIVFPLTQCKMVLKNKVISLPTYPIFFLLVAGNETIIIFWAQFESSGKSCLFLLQGVGPQEYTLIKLEVLEPYPPKFR